MRDGQSWMRTYVSRQVNISARSILISAVVYNVFILDKKRAKNGILSCEHADNIYNMYVFFGLVLLQTSLGEISRNTIIFPSERKYENDK